MDIAQARIKGLVGQSEPQRDNKGDVQLDSASENSTFQIFHMKFLPLHQDSLDVCIGSLRVGSNILKQNEWIPGIVNNAVVRQDVN